MSIIIDLVIIAIIALCVLVGYHKGLTGSLLKIVSFVLALIIAFILFKPVSNFIIDKTDWDENLEQAIRQSILKDEEKTNDETQKENMPEVITDYINNAVEKAGNEAKTAIVDSTAREVAIMIINIAVAIALFIVSKIILLLVKGLANLLTKLITNYVYTKKNPITGKLEILEENRGLYIQGLTDAEEGKEKTEIRTFDIRGGNLGYNSYKLLRKYISASKNSKLDLSNCIINLNKSLCFI